jgi:hypothetical protein
MQINTRAILAVNNFPQTVMKATEMYATREQPIEIAHPCAGTHRRPGRSSAG